MFKDRKFDSASPVIVPIVMSLIHGWTCALSYTSGHVYKVDATGCLCNVDVGFKTVAETRRCVPGRKLCLQSDIKPSIHPTREKPSRNQNRKQSPLLPGLPDDLATTCLKMPLPPVPKEYLVAFGFGCAVLSGCHLYLFGGKDPVKGSMRRVVFYSARTNKWHRAPDMLRRRHSFGSCVINNCLYVAGGENEGINLSLRSAEVYDPKKNRWCFISDMSSEMVPLIGVVYEGKWFLKGLGAHRQVVSEVYQPETDSWCPACLW